MYNPLHLYWESFQFVLLGIFLFFLVIEKRYEDRKNIKTILASLTAILFSVYFFGPNLKAQWWLIDDHEVFYFLKSKTEPSGWKNYFDILLNLTEVGNFGNAQRYRVSYYALRIFEVLLWKDNAFVWYLIRFFISTFFIFSLLRILLLRFPFTISCLFVLSVFSFRYWSDIFSRMATSELYIVFGLSLLLTAFSCYKPKEKNSVWIYLLISLGTIVCLGSKENFIILTAIPIGILFWERSKDTSWWNRMILVFPILYSALIVISLYLFFKKVPVDIYGNRVSLSEKLAVFLTKFVNEFTIGIFALIVAFLAFSILEFIKIRKVKISIWFFLPLVFLGILLFNIVFYSGVWPTNSRYDFPGMILYQGAILALVFLIVSVVLRLFEVDIKHRDLVVNVVLIFFLCSVTSVKGITDLQRDSRTNMKRTQAFTSFLKEFLSDSSDRIIILYVHQAFDFEPVDAMTRFLNYYGDKNERMILVSESKAESDFKNGLLNYMRTLSKEGSPERDVIPFDSKKLKNRSCVLLFFPPASIEDAPNIPECKEYKKEIVPFQ
ncbi:hypothetical protein EFP84_18145 [Leptospira kmetyi]|uniref:Uncharacterized protein n=1 Tax=Leptospira kmetyi TaxID=408139 RepID=A0AAD0USP1_9LEPT|nr:hypothetical protein EFP84_18145 [Leptospira kmetyi]